MLIDATHAKCKVIFSLSASFIFLTCHHAFAVENRILELANDVASDLQQWKSEIQNDPAVQRAQSQAADLLIMLMVESRQLETAQVQAQQLGREFEFWTVAHPFLLSEGRFDEAIVIGDKIVDKNPRMRGFVTADTFSAIAKQQSIDAGFDYLDQLPSVTDGQTRSAMAPAYMQVGRHYKQRGDAAAVDRVLSRIESAQDREVAEAVLAATNTTIDETQIRPLFLRMVEGRSTFHRKSRARQAWYVSRVRAFAHMAESGITSFSHYREQLGSAASVDSLPVSDKAIGLGLDLIARTVCTPASQLQVASTTADNAPKIGADVETAESARTLLPPEQAAAELNGLFGGEHATSNGLIRSWIAYALSRSGYWTTQDVKVAWSTRHRYENPEWIIGFAAGFEQSGQGETVQRLVNATQTTNARCYLRIGQLISLVSDDLKLSSAPRHAMK